VAGVAKAEATGVKKGKLEIYSTLKPKYPMSFTYYGATCMGFFKRGITAVFFGLASGSWAGAFCFEGAGSIRALLGARLARSCQPDRAAPCVDFPDQL
jgi:hypothetical protein